MRNKKSIPFAGWLISLSLMGTLLLSGCSTAETSNTSSSSNETPVVAAATAGDTGTDNCGNTVFDNSTNASYDAKTTVSGSLNSFTARSDDYSIGYYISGGEFVSSESLLAQSDEAVSSLYLDLAADGYGFTSVYATGKDTTLDLTGKITVNDTSDGQYASDFTGLGTQIIGSNYARVNADNMDIFTTGFLRDAFIVDEHAQISVNNSTITTM
jgi:uncharacterized protein YceK